MIPVNSYEMVMTLGVQNKEQSEFKLNFNSQVADILSSSLYKCRDLAVIRELISNALDSHVAAKVTEPVKVTLPTKEFPTFIVEDFGVGMGKEFLLDLYSTYFYSSKHKTNDEVGGFGLGSKSPFAISSSFNVLSRKDGMETHISCSKLGDNTPKVVVLSHKPTDKPNGTTVSVPFDKLIKDLSNPFIMRYECWLKYNLFPTCPVELYHTIQDITSTDKKLIDTINVSTEVIIKNPEVLVNAGIIYGYWFYELPNKSSSYPLMYYTKTPLVVRIPVGKLALTPSREYLTNSQHNIDTFNEALEEIYKKNLSEFKEKFPDALPWDLDKKMYEEGYISKECLDLNKYSNELRVYSVHGLQLKKNTLNIFELAFARNIFVKTSKVSSPKPFASDTCSGNVFVGTKEMFEKLSKLLTFDEVITAKEYSKYRKPKEKEVRISNGSIYVNSSYLSPVDNLFIPENFLDRFPTLAELRNRNVIRSCCIVNNNIYPKLKEAFKESNIPFEGEEEFIERLKQRNYIAKSELEKGHFAIFQNYFFRYHTNLVVLPDDQASELKESGFPLLTADSPILKKISKEEVTRVLESVFKTADLNEIKNTLEYLDE